MEIMSSTFTKSEEAGFSNFHSLTLRSTNSMMVVVVTKFGNGLKFDSSREIDHFETQTYVNPERFLMERHHKVLFADSMMLLPSQIQ